MKKELNLGAFYCYLSGDQAMFLNRWDEVIEMFESYSEAEEYANKNIHLIDVVKPEAYNFRISNKGKIYPEYKNQLSFEFDNK
jgi:hypothetical protein